jgi:two-component system chemotaxis response regulator CheB
MIRVLIVDDSATARAVIKEILEEDSEIEVVGSAPDPFAARDKIVQLKPDVICLDVEMPRMDGVTFLKKLMEHFPTPVIMVSSLTQHGAKTTLDALDAGAIDFVPKPHTNIYDDKDDIREELIQKVKLAAKSKVKNKKAIMQKKQEYAALSETTNKIVLIGASTGGTEAIKDVLVQMPPNSPGIVIVQHMPPVFTQILAKRLEEMSGFPVHEATHNQKVENGHTYLAPGGFHMLVVKEASGLVIKLNEEPYRNSVRPAADYLFESADEIFKSQLLGVVLTGMGEDGAVGAKRIHDSGGGVVIQDKESCVVFGMPGAVFVNDDYDDILNLTEITNYLRTVIV